MTQLMVSFRGSTPPPWVLRGLETGEIGALCLFAFNAATPAALRALTAELHRAAAAGGHPPPLVGLDQEGGQLMAMAGGATELPGNMALGAARSPELATAAGRVLGRELLAMGCNLNFAPVLDVNTDPDNPAVGLRSFGDDPALVAELGAATIRGMQATGVLATAKHFPGHGDIASDPHHLAPVVGKGRAALDALELLPFRAALRAGVGAVMTAQVVYPALDPDRPAVVSAAVTRRLLREELGFGGLVLTDALDMGALAPRTPRERALEALAAGADLAMLGHLPDQPALLAAAAERLDATALARIRRARDELPREAPPLDTVGSAEHRAVAQAIADASITVVRGAARLPLRPAPGDRLAVLTVRPRDLTPADTSSAVTVRLAAAVAARHPATTAVEIPFGATPAAVAEALAAVAGADEVIVGTIAADRDPPQAELVRALRARGQRPVVVALRTPYDLRAFPEIDTYLCAYGVRDASTEATARVLFGEIEARGRLPCDLGLARPGDLASA